MSGDEIVAVASFFFTVVVTARLLIRRTPSWYEFVILFTWATMMNVAVFSISVGIGEEGYSFFSKERLADEVIFHESAKIFASNLLNAEALDFEKAWSRQLNKFGYAAEWSTVAFAPLLSVFYAIFTDSLLIGKLLVGVTFSTFLMAVRRLVLAATNSAKASRVAVLILFLYPSIWFRSVILQRDFLLLTAFFCFFLMLTRAESDEREIGKCSLAVVWLLIFLLRAELAVAILAAMALFKFAKRVSFFQVILIGLIASPFVIFLIKHVLPGYYDLLLRAKSFSVFAGETGFLKADYSSVLSTYQTMGISLWYYLMGPLGPGILSAGIAWKMLMWEPLLIWGYSIQTRISGFSDLSVRGKWPLSLNLMGMSSVMYSFSVVLRESHMSAYTRKRMVLFVSLIVIAIVARYVCCRNRINAYPNTDSTAEGGSVGRLG